jgi:PhnB protein
MSLTAVAHLNFHGEARQALEFYRSVFGGQLVVATYADFGMPAGVPGADHVVWGQVVADNGFSVMAYDVPGQGQPAPGGPTPSTSRRDGLTLTDQPFFLSVRGDTVAEVTPAWDGLAQGATVVEAFGPAAFAPAFGMLTDQFGVTWIVDVAGQPQS